MHESPPRICINNDRQLSQWQTNTIDAIKGWKGKDDDIGMEKSRYGRYNGKETKEEGKVAKD